MKKLITGLVLATAVATPAFSIASPDRLMDPQRRLDHMQRELDLTDEQRSQIEAIFQDHHEQMEALRDSTSDRINGVLTDEQQQQFEGMREERRERFRERLEERGEERRFRRDDD